ncbi:MAG: UDP-N-acetylglucosamine 2-epimerase, partial [bacterium]
MKKVLTVLGARPQFVKASVVSSALARTGVLEEVLVHTGQHFDANMSEVFFTEFAMPAPKHNLGIHGGRHGAMTGQMLEAIETVLLDERPDALLVYGDTNSTLAGALAAAKLHIPVAHVEAGLRSFNRATTADQLPHIAWSDEFFHNMFLRCRMFGWIKRVAVREHAKLLFQNQLASAALLQNL